MGRLWRRLDREEPSLEVDRELRFHLEMRAREFEASGMSPEDARAAAVRSFGDIQAISGECTEERTLRAVERRRREMWQGLGGDVRFAVRSLARRPGFTMAAVLTLGFGIALVAAVAGLVDAYLVRALPYAEADRLVWVEGAGSPDWRDPPAVFEAVAAWDLDGLSIVDGSKPEKVWASWVTPGFFEALGVRPALGRLFTESESRSGGAVVAVISDDLWRRRWGGDPGVLGQTFAAYSDDRPEETELFTIIGVLRSDFWYANRFTEVLAPLQGPRVVSMARLAPGVTAASAEAVLTRLARERGAERTEVRIVPARQPIVERIAPTLWAVGGAVAFVLLIACGNAAVLLLVRAAGREQEFAIRSAIGAGRGRVARQLVVEGLLLSFLAAAVGLVLAVVLLRSTGELVPRVLGVPVPGGTSALRVDALALMSAIGASTLAGVVFGMVPLSVAWRRTLIGSLTSGVRGTDTRRRQRTRSVLIAAELALSLSLLTGAALLVRSARHLQRVELGFDPANLVAVGLSLRQSTFGDAALRAAFFDRVTAGVERDLPGARAAVVSWAPFSRFGTTTLETQSRAADDEASAFVALASADYFDVIGIRILRGTGFDNTTVASGVPVAIVSESLARRMWRDADPIGKRVRIRAGGMSDADRSPGPWATVVGVVADVRKTLTEENPPDLYMPFAQSPSFFAELVVRDPTGRVRFADLQQSIWRINPELPLDEVRWIADDVALATLPSRFMAWLLSSFAVFAVVLATLGLYGVIAFAVGERRREIAIRMALGADGPRVIGLFLRQSALLVTSGVVLGLAGGYALSRILASQLYGVSPGDPMSYVTVAALLGVVALAATWVPSWRAARAQPMSALHRP